MYAYMAFRGIVLHGQLKKRLVCYVHHILGDRTKYPRRSPFSPIDKQFAYIITSGYSSSFGWKSE